MFAENRLFLPIYGENLGSLNNDSRIRGCVMGIDCFAALFSSKMKFSVFEKCWKPQKALAQLVQLIFHDTKIRIKWKKNIYDLWQQH